MEGFRMNRRCLIFVRGNANDTTDRIEAFVQKSGMEIIETIFNTNEKAVERLKYYIERAAVSCVFIRDVVDISMEIDEVKVVMILAAQHGISATYKGGIFLKWRNLMTAEEYRALLDTDFSDVKLEEMLDMAYYHTDLKDTLEKRQQKFIRKVGNPCMMRVGKMKVKVSFANNGISIEEAFKNMLLTA